MFQFFGHFGDDNFAHDREDESACKEVTKISDENKKNFEKVIAVKGEILEEVPLAITVYFSKKE